MSLRPNWVRAALHKNLLYPQALNLGSSPSGVLSDNAKQKGVGGGASGIASGLLHPYPGEDARLSWKGEEGMEETLRLLKIVGPKVYKETGILRIAVTEKQTKLFRERSKEREDVEWWPSERCHAFVQGSHYLPGIFIHSGITVHAHLYLKGLWKVCEKLGAQFEKKNVSIKTLGEEFDAIVIAAGGGVRNFLEGNRLNLRFNKGQILICTRPSYFEKKSSIIGKGYIAQSDSEDRCFLGSTYEREYITEAPCIGTATDLIFKQIGQFLPATSSFHVEGCRAEMRVIGSKGYKPIAEKLEEGLYVMTGMGSRGLLYHSYIGKQLANMLLETSTLPLEVEV